MGSCNTVYLVGKFLNVKIQCRFSDDIFQRIWRKKHYVLAIIIDLCDQETAGQLRLIFIRHAVRA
jgi:hypothetical protein